MPFQKQEKKKQYQGLDKVYEFNKSEYYETVNKDNKRETLKPFKCNRWWVIVIIVLTNIIILKSLITFLLNQIIPF